MVGGDGGGVGVVGDDPPNINIYFIGGARNAFGRWGALKLGSPKNIAPLK